MDKQKLKVGDLVLGWKYEWHTSYEPINAVGCITKIDKDYKVFIIEWCYEAVEEHPIHWDAEYAEKCRSRLIEYMGRSDD